ncbi:MAG TPA: glycosyltransferase family 4 protein [Edaphobacter sp.]|nr:glycosyltransferase family 4 protein [Edaphobacter sp.]
MMDLWATVPYYTAYLSRALMREGVDVRVGSISYYLDPTCFSSRGIKLRPGFLDIVGKFNLPRLPRRILKLLESVLNLSALTVSFLISPPDIIHVQYLAMVLTPFPVDLWFIQLCRRRCSKIILTVHDLMPHDTGDAHQETFRKLYGMVDGIICHSDSISRRLAVDFSVPEEKIAVIPHGPFFYDLPETEAEKTRIQSGKLFVLWQGIIFPYKGIDLLLNAWQRVEAKNDHAYLMIAGTGSPELTQQIHQQIKQLDLKHVELDLRFVSTEELVALYRAADVVVYPYRAITTSGALATGLALGKTIVASNLAVFRELLTDRQNALLVDPQEASALSSAILELCENFSLRDQLAANVRAMNFGDQSWLLIAEQTKKFYLDILSRFV